MKEIRTENGQIITGNKFSDLVLETLGKIYIKTGNKSEVLDNLIQRLISEADKPKTIFVNNESEMKDMKYPGDGAFIYNKLTDSLYMALDNRYILVVLMQTDDTPQYVNKDGDSMSGPLEIITISAPLIVYSSLLVKNLNAEYLNNYSSDDFAKKKIDEVIYGSWSFDSPCYANNNWIFKENTRFYRDIVTSGSISSPLFAGGFGGYGWMIDANTNTLTIDNIVVRKAMLVYEMVINQISATNGSMWVTNSVKVKETYRPYIITKEELDEINTGTKEEINAKLNNIFWNNSYFLITDLNLTINQDTNNLGVASETNIGLITETKGLSSANNINIVPKEFVNFKYIIWIGDLNKVLDDETFPGVSAFYDENYLFNVNTNLDLKAYYLSKEIQVTEWNEDNTPKVSNYLSTFNKGSEIFIVPRDSSEVVGLKPYYKYFALSRDLINSALVLHVNEEIKKVPVPTIYIIDTDDSTNPTLKSGDVIRCLKYEDNNIKYYDAIITSHFKSKGYILQKASSVFDTYTEVSYTDTGELESRTEVDNSTLYNKTEKTYNPSTGEYEDNYPTTEKIADVAANDDLIQMGNIYNTLRQNAIYITSTDDLGPYIDIMSGLNRPDYSVIYDLPVYKKIKVFVKQKGDIFVLGEPSDYYYQKENPQAINFNQKPAYISGNTKKYPLVYITVDEELNTTGTYINDGELNNIPEDTSQGYFITNYPTQYSLVKEGETISNKITKVRLGNLDGIYNETFGNKQPYGFGLYGENVFLTGEFYLNNGKSVVEFSTDLIFLKYGEAGLKIAEDEEGKSYILLTADLTKVTASNGKDIAIFTVDENGNPYLSADLVKADTVITSKLIADAIKANELNVNDNTIILSDGTLIAKLGVFGDFKVDGLYLTSSHTYEHGCKVGDGLFQSWSGRSSESNQIAASKYYLSMLANGELVTTALSWNEVQIHNFLKTNTIDSDVDVVGYYACTTAPMPYGKRYYAFATDYGDIKTIAGRFQGHFAPTILEVTSSEFTFGSSFLQKDATIVITGENGITNIYLPNTVARENPVIEGETYDIIICNAKSVRLKTSFGEKMVIKGTEYTEYSVDNLILKGEAQMIRAIWSGSKWYVILI